MTTLVQLAETALLEFKQLEPLFNAAREHAERNGRIDVQRKLDQVLEHVSSLSARHLLAIFIAFPLGTLGPSAPSKREMREELCRLSAKVSGVLLSPSGPLGWAAGLAGYLTGMIPIAFDTLDVLIPADLQKALVEWFVRHQRIALSQACHGHGRERVL